MVVHEDWDHAKKQKVLEEEEIFVEEEDVMFSDVNFPEDLAGTNGAMPAGNPQKLENQEVDRSAAVVADAPLQGEIVVLDVTNQPQVTAA